MIMSQLLYIIVFALIYVIFLTTAFKYHCTDSDILRCLKESSRKALENHSKEVTILLDHQIQDYSLSDHFVQDGRHHTSFEIISDNAETVKILRGKSARLVFLNMNKVNFNHIGFYGPSDYVQEIYDPFLTINNSKSIKIENCRFSKLQGNAISIYTQNNSNEDFNLFINHSIFDGTGDAKRPSQGIFIRLENTGNAVVSVRYSIFKHFKTDNSSHNLTMNQRILYRPLAFEQSNNFHSYFRKFSVSHCKFEYNVAYVGGGLGVYTSNVSNSHYTITNSNFTGNTVVRRFLKGETHNLDVSGSGGGIAALLFNCQDCSIRVLGCRFHNNTGALGGGIKVGYYFVSPRVDIWIRDSVFSRNTANSGSGLYIEAQLVHPAVPQQAVLADLKFLSNVAMDFGAGIFVAYLPLRLEGKRMIFFNNTNTSLSVISSQIEVNTDLNFTQNNGSRGGALFLSDNSQLLLNQSVSLVFIKNRAKDKGGAIYADSISLDLLYRNYGYTFYNVHCFIKHFIKFDPSIPDNYTQKILFQENYAPTGAAIYTHTLSPCAWFSNSKPYSNITKALRWATYTYKNNEHQKSEIATAVAHYFISQDNKDEEMIQRLIRSGVYEYTPRHVKLNVVPGNASKIYFHAYDQLGLSEVSIATVQPNDKTDVTPCNDRGDKSIFLTSSSTPKDQVVILFCGRPGTSGNVSFKALDGLTIEHTVSVHLEDCLNGSFWNESDKSCHCYELEEPDLFWKQDINASKHQYGWMKTATNNTFAAMTCPASYCNRPSSDTKCADLPDKEKCKNGRVGLGCSSCDHSRTMKSGSLECTKECDQKNTTTMTVLLFLLLLIIISVLFLIRSSSYFDAHIQLREALFPYARSFIFFCQGVFILYLNNNIKAILASQFITKTGFFFTYDMCYSIGFTSPRGRVFEEYFFYMIGFVVIFLIAFLVNCIITRCIPIRFKASVIAYTLVSYSFLTYTPIAFTTLRLLSCGKLTVYSSILGTVSTHHKIWYYDATQACYGTNADILISSIAFLVLLLYIIPLPFVFILLALKGTPELYRKIVKRFRKARYMGSGRVTMNPSKFDHVMLILKKISSGYLNAFPEPLFGFWIPFTMLANLTLLIIQTNGPLFDIQNDKQAQLMAIVCFFFLYIRVSLEISKDIFVQLYDAISILFLCISCIFLIIFDNVNVNDNIDNDLKPLRLLVKYFPLAAYITLFIAILVFPIIKYFYNKHKSATPDNEKTDSIKAHSSLHTLITSDNEEFNEPNDPNDIEVPLLQGDHLENSSMHEPLPFQADRMLPIPIRDTSMSRSYAHSQQQSTGTPGHFDAFNNPNLDSLELSDNAHMRDDD